ncbi:AGE family epimerase/isomerase [Inquilinus limosus]|uniref:AGE family epimerase/isomerase n=1 Tax=Inquilinus limosus TaxID=171674 RepID=UPI000A6707FE|nr:AGE family epimerase/isomerase [Inquilinus limosus]
MPEAVSIADPAALRRATARHLTDDVLAWWLATSPDDRHGGVFTCWSNDGGRLLSRDKYTWSQGRWVWLMARLARAGRLGLVEIDRAACLHRARRTAVLLRDHALLADGSTAYLLAEDGTPKPPGPGQDLHASVFADLFVALGSAALAAESGEGEWGALAERLLASAAGRIAAGTARTEPYPIRAGFRGFSLPMILIGVGAEVLDATGSAVAAETVLGAVQKIETMFLAGDDIAEMAPAAASDADTLLARHRTPGHVLEACWFLWQAGQSLRHRGIAAESPLFEADTLADIAIRAATLGWDAEQGGLLRYADRDGGAPRGRRTGDRYEELVADTWDTKLWWPHAEALYTLGLLYLETGRDDLAAWHDRLAAYTWRVFPAGPGREWVQIRNRAGAPLDKTVALPVKDPFHIARALLLMIERLAEVPPTERSFA